MKIYTGTSGFSYKEWKGSFYPEKLPIPKMLSYYAGRLGSVEINNTFYRLPKVEVLQRWREDVGPDFRFAIKASRRITHFSRLRETAYEPTAYLLQTVRELGESLGTVLFQLPPNLKADTELLSAFLSILPDDLQASFEFRNPTWHSEAIHDLLSQKGAALVRSDTEDSDSGDPLVSTAPWGYLRLRRPEYSAAELDSWAERIHDSGWKRVFVFFKHEDGAAGPRLAESFGESFAGTYGSK